MTNPDRLPHTPHIDRRWISEVQVILSDIEWAIAAGDFAKLKRITAKGRRQNRTYREIQNLLALTGQGHSHDD